MEDMELHRTHGEAKEWMQARKQGNMVLQGKT